MHYFRYRSFSEISLKELLYSEMYFSSPEECNDPFDSKTFYVFNDDQEKWSRIIQFASNHYNIPVTEKKLKELLEFICELCPLTFEEVTKNDLFKKFLKIGDGTRITFLVKAIQELLNIYKPSTRYFVSFSKVNYEPLMWSHYADKHKGFCLIFKAINGVLNLSPHFKKDQISRQTPGGLASQMSYALPDSFKFIDINYKHEVEFLNAFLHMPVYVSGDAKNDEERLKILEEQESHYLQKGQNWFYEKESRLILVPPPSWLFGGHIDFTKQERLFHYEPSQLAGIIYGARMRDGEKDRVREILQERKNYLTSLNNYKRTEFGFIEFESKLSTNQRNVEVEPISILSYKTISSSDADFDRLYADWKNGIGHLRDGNSSKRIQVD